MGYWQTRGDRARLEFAGKAPNPTDPAPKPLPGRSRSGRHGVTQFLRGSCGAERKMGGFPQTRSAPRGLFSSRDPPNPAGDPDPAAPGAGGAQTAPSEAPRAPSKRPPTLMGFHWIFSHSRATFSMDFLGFFTSKGKNFGGTTSCSQPSDLTWD